MAGRNSMGIAFNDLAGHTGNASRFITKTGMSSYP